MRPASHSDEIRVPEIPPTFEGSSDDSGDEAQGGTLCPGDDVDYCPSENRLLKSVNR